MDRPKWEIWTAVKSGDKKLEYGVLIVHPDGQSSVISTKEAWNLARSVIQAACSAELEGCLIDTFRQIGLPDEKIAWILERVREWKPDADQSERGSPAAGDNSSGDISGRKEG